MVHLKSNMDIFIACKDMLNAGLNCDLKSNMDRFIDMPIYYDLEDYSNLKSNMDRFIGNAPGEIHHVDRVFKIQYG